MMPVSECLSILRHYGASDPVLSLLHAAVYADDRTTEGVDVRSLPPQTPREVF